MQDELIMSEQFLQFCEMFYCDEVVFSVAIYSMEQWGRQDMLNGLLYNFQPWF